MGDDRTPMLDVDRVSVTFGERPVLSQWSLAVDTGEIVALQGPSGSGKSTVLRVVAGLIAPDAGTVSIDGVDVTAVPTHRRSVGMVFQDEQLFPHLDVAGNIGYGLRIGGVAASDRERRVADLLDLVGLTGFGPRSVTRLSGGEAKRVALARSLAVTPRVLTLDEPLTGLDADLQHQLALDVTDILRRTRTTAVWVTHDADEAALVADRIVHLDVSRGVGHDVRHPGAQGGADRWRVREVSAQETHDLRRRVLRVGTPSREVRFDGDDEALHLAAFDGPVGSPVGVSTWRAVEYAGEPGTPAWQLRGMATDPAVRGTGAGAALVRAGIDRAVADGAELIWARARVTAIDWYEHLGFRAVGPVYQTADTAMDHRDILLRPRRRDASGRMR